MNGNNQTDRTTRLRYARTLIVIFLCILVVILLMLFLKFSTTSKQTVNTSEDVIASRLYSQYKFSGDENVINMGTQPLYLPTGMITEVMKRDLILKKALSEQGLTLMFYPFYKGNDVNYFMKRGDLEMGVGGDMPALNAASTIGVTITNLMQSGFTSVVARQHQSITNLRGAKIAYAPGSNAHYSLLRGLDSAGLSDKDVKFVAMDVNDMPEALKSGKINAFSAWEPEPYLAIKKDKTAAVIYRNLRTGYLYFRNSFTVKHKKAMIKIVAAAIRATKWMQLDEKNMMLAASWSKKDIEAFLGERFPLSDQEIMLIAKQDIFKFNHTFQILKRSLDIKGSLYNEFLFLKAEGIISDKSSWNDMRNSFNTEILDEIYAEPKKYQIDVYQYNTEEAKSE